MRIGMTLNDRLIGTGERKSMVVRPAGLVPIASTDVHPTGLLLHPENGDIRYVTQGGE